MSGADVTILERDDQVRTLLRGPRVRLLDALRERPDSASGLAARLGLTRQSLNYHLRQLETAGLIELVGERGHGRCVERILAPIGASYAVSPNALGPLAPRSCSVGERTSAEYMAARACDVVRDIGSLIARGQAVPTLTLETEVAFASAEERAAFARELERAISRLAAGYASGRGTEARFTLLVAAHPLVEARGEAVRPAGSEPGCARVIDDRGWWPPWLTGTL